MESPLALARRGPASATSRPRVGWLGWWLTLGVIAGVGIAATPVFDPVVFKPWNAPGFRFVTEPSRTSHKHQPETMVAGVALFDYDDDGWLDIYVVNGATMPGLDKERSQVQEPPVPEPPGRNVRGRDDEGRRCR